MTTPALPQMTDPKPPANPSSQPPGNPTPPISTDPPTDPAINLAEEKRKRMEALHLRTIQEQGAKLTNVEAELAQLKADSDARNAPTPDEDAKKFYANPRAIIREELDKVIAPLNEFRRDFQNENEYTRLLAGFKQDPRYAKYLANPTFSNYVGDLVSHSMKNGGQLSADMIDAAVRHGLGSVLAGDLVLTAPVAPVPPTDPSNPNPPSGDPPVTPAPDNYTRPPYLEPTPPLGPDRTPAKPALRELTESEDRLRKERGKTVEEFLAWQNMADSEVLDSKLGIPEPKGTK